jgi:uncharacterized protein YigA (DUF484 family)
MSEEHSAAIINLDSAARLRLEGKVRRLAMERDALIQTMRTNHASTAQIHGAVLALVDARDLGMLDQRLAGHVRQSLGADVLRVLVEGLQSPDHTRAIQGAPKGLVLRVMDGHNERLGPCQTYGPDVFGTEAEALRSEMLIRINVRGREGLFALGSRDRLTFRPDQGTDLASFLARVVERLVAAWAPA